MEDHVTYDPNAYQFMKTKFPDSKQQSGSDRLLATCPSCNHKAKFWWYDKMPHYGGCFACGYKLNSIFDLGYRSEGGKKSFGDLSSIESLTLSYHNKSGKRHRLSKRVVDEFSLQAIKFQKKSGVGHYYNIAIPDNTAMGCTKHLSFDGRWISIQSKFRNDRKWLNHERLDKTKEHVFVLAGEWDMFAFWEHTGIHGVSPVDGEGTAGKLEAKEYDIFSNKKVVVLFDNDKAGRLGARSLILAIRKYVKTKSLKFPDLSRLGLLGGQDIDDFFSSGGTKERLWEEIQATPEYEPELDESDIELQRIEDPFPMPQYKSEVLDTLTLSKVWKTLLLPSAQKTILLDRIAESEGLSKEMAPVAYKARMKIYEAELNTLKFKSFEKLIADWFDKYHIKQATRFSDMSDALYYFYEDGFYQFLSEDFLMLSADDIAKKVTPPDDRTELSRMRRQALEDIRIKLVSAPETSFDSHKDYINFTNGTYILREKRIVPHSHAFLLNYKLPIVYDPSSDCPNFKEALSDWTHSTEDKRELLKALYYLISGDRSKSVVLWLHGDGNDGKGEFIQLCKALIGDKRTSSLAIETIEKTHYTAELYNKMLNIADEVPKNFIIPDAMFKRISGNSVITGDPKYKGLISFVSKALWVIPSNHFPNVADTSHGYFRRFKIFHFKKIPKSKEVGHFFETKLKGELPGIVNHILTDGRHYYETEGFIKTQSEIASTVEMKEKNSAFLYWNSVFAAWDNMIGDMEEELKRLDDWSRFDNPEEALRYTAIARLVPTYEDLSQTKEFDVVQYYPHKGDKIMVCNPNAHYKFYREYFQNDEVRLSSLANFRQSTINFFKEYFANKTVEKIRIWSRNAESKDKKNLTYIWVR